jgi:hypothetical protein
MTTAPGSRPVMHEVVRRIYARRVGVRRHVSTVCIASIVLALPPVTSIQVEARSLPRNELSRAAAAVELTARLCVVDSGCGSLTIRLGKG